VAAFIVAVEIARLDTVRLVPRATVLAPGEAASVGACVRGFELEVGENAGRERERCHDLIRVLDVFGHLRFKKFKKIQKITNSIPTTSTNFISNTYINIILCDF
jgi:hypothetical protein